MTIVATADTRNSAWANDTTSYGHKMLAKMGWKGGDAGLGKNQQGTRTNLRAVRRAESLGIGAESDAFGDKGWDDTKAGFHGVLASLNSMHSSVASSRANSDDDGSASSSEKKKRRKEEKKRRKKEEKRRAKRIKSGGSGSDDGIVSSGARPPRNKVQAGHARKMREAKDIRNKSAEDMAAIFGVKADFYKQQQSQSREDLGGAAGEDKGSSSDTLSSLSAGEKKRKRKESKEKGRSTRSEVEKSKKEKKKRRSSSSGYGSDSDRRKKSAKAKSKK